MAFLVYKFLYKWVLLLKEKNCSLWEHILSFIVVVDLLFYVHGKYLRSGRDSQLT